MVIAEPEVEATTRSFVSLVESNSPVLSTKSLIQVRATFIGGFLMEEEALEALVKFEGGLRAELYRFSSEEEDGECKHNVEWEEVDCGTQWGRVGSFPAGHFLIEINIVTNRMRR
nr:hypothetical protein [Tanacetum cinerariifolium]